LLEEQDWRLIVDAAQIRQRWVRGEVDNFHPTLQNPLPIYLVNLYCLLSDRERILGPDHPSTLFTQRELAYLREQHSD
jgi:hypothetical protein